MVPSAERTDPVTDGPSRLVLVVEDEALVCRTMVQLLLRWGYTTLEAPDGGVALEQVRTWGGRLSAVLLDLMLPVLTGMEVARSIREGWPDLPIVACSAAIDPAIEADLRLLGVQGFLHKPFRTEELRAILLHVTHPS